MPHPKSLSVLLVLAALISGCGHLVYPSGPYRGRVIDTETKQPLAGAAVVAVWLWQGPGLGHPREGLHDVLEVLTDTDGEFTIPRKTHFSLSGEVGEPYFSIYYPSYGPFPGFQVQPTGAALNSAFREHTVVELPRMRTRDERLKVLGWAGPPVTVPQEKTPNLRRLLDQERRALGLRS